MSMNSKLYIYSIYLLFISSMYPWFLWNTSINYLITFISVLVSISVFAKKDNCNKNLNCKHKLYSLLLLYTIIYSFRLNIFGIANCIVNLFIWYVLLMQNNETKHKILNFVTKWFAILLGISLIFYLLWLFGIFSPPCKVLSFDDNNYESTNYYFFITQIDGRLLSFVRFQSIFLEPGHLIMGIVPLIIANKFDLKNMYVCILCLCIFFSFSLAGYITFIIGYCMMRFKNNVKAVFSTFFLVGLLFVLIQKFGFEDAFNSFIFNRINEAQNTSLIDNRTSDYVEREYQNVMSSTDIFFGSSTFDNTKGEQGSSGYKVFISEHGIILFVITLLIYTYYYRKNKTYHNFVFSVVLLLLLLQNTYPSWNCIMFSYILGSETNNKSLKNESIVNRS